MFYPTQDILYKTIAMGDSDCSEQSNKTATLPDHVASKQGNPTPSKVSSTTRTPMHTQQPGMAPSLRGTKFMPAPAMIAGIPPGLEYLAAVNGISLIQLMKWNGFSKRQTYSLLNTAGQQVYFASGNHWPFNMIVLDNFERPIIVVQSPGTFFGPASQCVVECPPGREVGRVFQSGGCCRHEFVVDVAGRPVFNIQGESCANDYQQYTILDANGMSVIGSLNKCWNGIFSEDSIIVKFPMNLDVNSKALLLGATFYFNYVAMEHREQAQRNTAIH